MLLTGFVRMLLTKPCTSIHQAPVAFTCFSGDAHTSHESTVAGAVRDKPPARQLEKHTRPMLGRKAEVRGKGLSPRYNSNVIIFIALGRYEVDHMLVVLGSYDTSSITLPAMGIAEQRK